MGRYDGEDYIKGPMCKPGKHKFMMNGVCHICRYTKDELIQIAETYTTKKDE